MRTHQEIDLRSLELARAIVERIDADPLRSGLEKARSVCARWGAVHGERAMGEWRQILTGQWDRIRAVLLDESENGRRLRQSSPFCGVLSAKERWEIYRRFRIRDQKAV